MTPQLCSPPRPTAANQGIRPPLPPAVCLLLLFSTLSTPARLRRGPRVVTRDFGKPRPCIAAQISICSASHSGYNARPISSLRAPARLQHPTRIDLSTSCTAHAPRARALAWLAPRSGLATTRAHARCRPALCARRTMLSFAAATLGLQNGLAPTGTQLRSSQLKMSRFTGNVRAPDSPAPPARALIPHPLSLRVRRVPYRPAASSSDRASGIWTPRRPSCPSGTRRR